MSELNPLVANHHLIKALWSAVNTSTGSIDNVAPLVAKILTTGAWRKRQVPQLNNEVVQYDQLGKFITDPPLKGCGWAIENVDALLKKACDPETYALWRNEITPPKHVHHDGDNVTIKPERGNSQAYTLARLQRERPDLFKLVKAKVLSANKAAIEAGWRKKPKLVCPACGHEFVAKRKGAK